MKDAIKIALDEINAVIEVLERGHLSEETRSKCNSWIRKQKNVLKENNYRGKIRKIKKGCK